MLVETTKSKSYFPSSNNTHMTLKVSPPSEEGEVRRRRQQQHNSFDNSPCSSTLRSSDLWIIFHAARPSVNSSTVSDTSISFLTVYLHWWRRKKLVLILWRHMSHWFPPSTQKQEWRKRRGEASHTGQDMGTDGENAISSPPVKDDHADTHKNGFDPRIPPRRPTPARPTLHAEGTGQSTLCGFLCRRRRLSQAHPAIIIHEGGAGVFLNREEGMRSLEGREKWRRMEKWEGN